MKMVSNSENANKWEKQGDDDVFEETRRDDIC